MNDITIVYYTANLNPPGFSAFIQKRLVLAAAGIPIISVSHKPLYTKYGSGSIDATGGSVSIDPKTGYMSQHGPFGYNICVGEIEKCYTSVFKQIQIGAMAAETDWIALCEDDCLYVAEHFAYRPTGRDVFAYNINRWTLTRKGGKHLFFWRHRKNMSTCIAPRKALLKALKERFAMYPDMSANGALIGEFGRFEKRFGLTRVQMEVFETALPVVVVNHRHSLGGKRQVLPKDTLRDSIPVWGDADALMGLLYA